LKGPLPARCSRDRPSNDIDCSEERHGCFDKRFGCADRATEHALNSRNNHFFTEGVRTIWFILFLIVAYAILPFVYQAIYRKHDSCKGAFIVITILLLGLPVLLHYSNMDLFRYVEVALTRLPLFVAGAFFGKYIRDGIVVPHSCIAALISVAVGLNEYSGALKAPVR
jgi:surface polysaccharide O-acyltransferase-like enzyme